MKLIPEDGSAIGNQSLLSELQKRAQEVTEELYQAARDDLIQQGELSRGRGRGGSVFRVVQMEEEAADEDVTEDAEGDGGGTAAWLARRRVAGERALA